MQLAGTRTYDPDDYQRQKDPSDKGRDIMSSFVLHDSQQSTV
jgi:hypothetical protein